jgi:predicted KAP-like P-loop ATPase
MPARSRRKHQALLADVPVDLPKDDQLGRAPFAKTLATTIKSMKGLDSFVFGLCGPWGSGKSSVLKLVERELESGRSANNPLVCNFNPWWFSGQDQLLRAFLNQLGSIAGRIDTGGRVSGLGQKLSTLGKILRPVSWIPGARVVKDISEVLDSSGEAAKKLGEELSLDVTQIRKDIDSLLRESKQRIVVMMDDIDRLTAQEIAQLFLIVKAVADFPNTVYLLAFDHAVVSKAISSALGLDGAAYLEKIVQVQIDIPPANPVKLQQLFLSQLDGLLDGIGVSEPAKKDFANLFHDGLKEFLHTPRSVKRLTNVLRVLLPSVRGEVYWPDFIGVTSLMVFAPEAYRVIRDASEHFTGTKQLTTPGREEAKRFHEGWLSCVPEVHREAVRQLVQRLFPKVESVLGGHGYAPGWESGWRAEHRICSPDCFDRFFQLRVPEGELSEAEWQDVVQLLDDPVGLDRFIATCCKSQGPHGFASRAKEFLERAGLFAKHQANADQAKKLFKALVRNGDLLIGMKDTDRSNLIPIDNKQRLMWAVQDALQRVDAGPERDQLVEESLTKKDAGLHTAAEAVWFFGAEHGKYHEEKNRSHKQPHLSLACVERLEANFLDRVKNAANDGSLEEDPTFLQVVFEWRRFGGEQEAKAWIQQLGSSDQGFVRIVDQLKGNITIHGILDRVASQVPTVSAQILLHWFDGIEAKQRAEKLLATPPNWLTPEQTESLKLLTQSIDADGKAVDLHRPSQEVESEDEVSAEAVAAEADGEEKSM